MVQTEKRRRPSTLKEHNNSRLVNEILTGKEFRRLRRKKKK